MIGKEDLEALAHQIRRAVYVARLTSLIASRQQRPGQIYFDIQFYLFHPLPGDYVAEMSSVRRGTAAIDSVGILISEIEEPIVLEEGETWDEAARGYPHPSELVTRIRTLDGRELRWTNCEFAALTSDLSVINGSWIHDRKKQRDRHIKEGSIMPVKDILDHPEIWHELND